MEIAKIATHNDDPKSPLQTSQQVVTSIALIAWSTIVFLSLNNLLNSAHPSQDRSAADTKRHQINVINTSVYAHKGPMKLARVLTPYGVLGLIANSMDIARFIAYNAVMMALNKKTQ